MKLHPYFFRIPLFVAKQIQFSVYPLKDIIKFDNKITMIKICKNFIKYFKIMIQLFFSSLRTSVSLYL